MLRNSVLAKVLSAALVGLDAYPVEVEVDIGGGLPQFSVVGLPDATVRESRDRVRAALKNTGFSFPVKKITVNQADRRRTLDRHGLPSLTVTVAAGGERDGSGGGGGTGRLSRPYPA